MSAKAQPNGPFAGTSVNTLFALLPHFAVIAVGALIGPRLAETSWRQIDRLCYYLFYPVLLFGAASQRHIALDSFLLIGLLACGLVTVGVLLAWCARTLAGEDSRPNKAGVSQDAWHFNTALGFVAVTALPIGAAGVLAIIVGWLLWSCSRLLLDC